MVASKFLTLLGLAALAVAAPAKVVIEYGLNDYAKKAGKLYFGTAADIPAGAELNDKYYMQQLNNTRDFGQVVPANVMKWVYSEPQRNKFDFSLGDQFVRIAKANKQVLRCHNLIWHEQMPGWISSTKWTKAALLAAVENRVKTTIAHYGDSCYAWDVVNEALNDDGTYRASIFYNVTGAEYIATAFKAAQEAVTTNKLKVKLYYNDYNIEYPGVKATAAQNKIVKLLHNQKIRIDGVGLQSHFLIGGTPSAQAQMENMGAFAALGVEVAVTELDIRSTTMPVSDAMKKQQVADYNSTVSACVLTKSCVGVTLWDFDDQYSWVPSTFPGQGWATPWYQPKGANTPLIKKTAYGGPYGGILSGLNVATTKAPTNSTHLTLSSSTESLQPKHHQPKAGETPYYRVRVAHNQ